ncbi:unnamed protein product, partial [Mesorhabditis spiculigera]
MARMKRHLLAIVLLLGIAGVACQKSNEDDNSQETDADNKLTISSKENVVKADDKLVVSCVFNGDLADPADLKLFRRNAGKHHSGGLRFLYPRVFTISLAEHKTGHRKKNLHFLSLEASDSGTYTCVATDLDGKVHRAQSKIDVTPPVHWADTATVVGGLAGERLIINCGASGEPSPLSQNSPRNPSIDMQLLDAVQFYPATRLPPTRSPSTYTFYEEAKIHDAERFSLVKHVLDHSAALTIKHVTIDDLGEYRCDVNNGKGSEA